MLCQRFVVYLTQIICYVLIFIALLLFDILKFHININMFIPFLHKEKDLSLETIDSPQFQFSVSCYFEILDLYILAVFGFWITLMSPAYVSLGASIFVLVTLFARSLSVCITIHITVFFWLLAFCHSHYFLSIFGLHFTSFLFTVF